jgi:hypothetical protein
VTSRGEDQGFNAWGAFRAAHASPEAILNRELEAWCELPLHRIEEAGYTGSGKNWIEENLGCMSRSFDSSDSFQVSTQAGQARVPAGANLGNPFGCFAQRLRDELVAHLLALTLSDDQAGAAQDYQVLDDGLPTDRQLAFERCRRRGAAFGDQSQHLATRRVRQGGEHGIGTVEGQHRYARAVI